MTEAEIRAAVEAMARALHANNDAFPSETYMDSKLTDWGDGDLTACVDGDVNFTKLARAAFAEFERLYPAIDLMKLGVQDGRE